MLCYNSTVKQSEREGKLKGAKKFTMGVTVKQANKIGQSNSTLKQSEIVECLQTSH